MLLAARSPVSVVEALTQAITDAPGTDGDHSRMGHLLCRPVSECGRKKSGRGRELLHRKGMTPLTSFAQNRHPGRVLGGMSTKGRAAPRTIPYIVFQRTN